MSTVEGFENNQNICEKLICVFKFRIIHHNTCRFWLKILIYIYIYIYIYKEREMTQMLLLSMVCV